MKEFKSYYQLITETEYMLDNYLPSGLISNLKFYLRNEIKKLLKRGYNKKDAFNWPAGLLLKGLTDAVEYLESEEFSAFTNSATDDVCMDKVSSDKVASHIVSHIEAYLAPYLNKLSNNGNGNKIIGDVVSSDSKLLKIDVLDDAITAETFLWMYERTSKAEYKYAADAVFLYLMKHKKDLKGSLIYRPVQGNSFILADMVGMVCPFLAKYGIMFSSTEALDLCEKQLVNFINYGFDTLSKLPYHGYELVSDEVNNCSYVNYGIIGWGRAVGWILRGESYYLKAILDNNIVNVSDDYIKIKANFNELCSTVMKYKKSNMFSWQVQATNGPIDMSGTSMIWDSILEVKNIDFGGESRNDIKDCMDSIETEINSSVWNYIKEGKVTNTLAECLGFSMHPQIYGSYPWGQGVTLSMISKLRVI